MSRWKAIYVEDRSGVMEYRLTDKGTFEKPLRRVRQSVRDVRALTERIRNGTILRTEISQTSGQLLKRFTKSRETDDHAEESVPTETEGPFDMKAAGVSSCFSGTAELGAQIVNQDPKGPGDGAIPWTREALLRMESVPPQGQGIVSVVKSLYY